MSAESTGSRPAIYLAGLTNRELLDYAVIYAETPLEHVLVARFTATLANTQYAPVAFTPEAEQLELNFTGEKNGQT
jgi:hypothetical protein